MHTLKDDLEYFQPESSTYSDEDLLAIYQDCEYESRKPRVLKSYWDDISQYLSDDHLISMFNLGDELAIGQSVKNSINTLYRGAVNELFAKRVGERELPENIRDYIRRQDERRQTCAA